MKKGLCASIVIFMCLVGLAASLSTFVKLKTDKDEGLEHHLQKSSKRLQMWGWKSESMSKYWVGYKIRAKVDMGFGGRFPFEGYM